MKSNNINDNNGEIQCSRAHYASSALGEGEPRRVNHRACEACRKLKVRCKGGNPCPSCRQRSRTCYYTVAASSGRPSKGRITSLQRRVEYLEKELAESRREQVDTEDTSMCGSNSSPQAMSVQSECSTQMPPKEGNLMEMMKDNESLPSLLSFTSHSLQANHTEISSDTADKHSKIAHSHTTIPGLWNDQASTSFNHPIELSSTLLPAGVNLHWPSKERERRLLEVYFSLVHPSFPIISPHIFSSKECKGIWNYYIRDPSWLSIKLGIFALAAQHIKSEQSNLYKWSNARLQLGCNILRNKYNLGDIQNLLITCKIQWNISLQIRTSWMTLGIAIRAMQIDGSYQEDSSRNGESKSHEEVLHVMRCLWWTAQSMELDMCSSLGQVPVSVSHSVKPLQFSATSSTPTRQYQAKLMQLPLLQKVAQQKASLQGDEVTMIASQLESWALECHREQASIKEDGTYDSSVLFAWGKLSLLVETTIVVFYRLEWLKNLSLSSRGDNHSNQSWPPASYPTVKAALQRAAGICRGLLRASRNINYVLLVDEEVALRALRLAVTACLLSLLECQADTQGMEIPSLKYTPIFLEILKVHSLVSPISARGYAFASTVFLHVQEIISSRTLNGLASVWPCGTTTSHQTQASPTSTYVYPMTRHSSLGLGSNLSDGCLFDLHDQQAWQSLFHSEVKFIEVQHLHRPSSTRINPTITHHLQVAPESFADDVTSSRR